MSKPSKLPANDNFSTFEMSPEAATLLQQQHDLDYQEVGPKVPISAFTYKGIRLESRFSVAHEFETMKAVVDTLPDLVVRQIVYIWCDSKGCAFYSVGLKKNSGKHKTIKCIKDAFITPGGGFNGLSIYNGENILTGDIMAEFDPEWDEFYPEWDGEFPDPKDASDAF